MMSSAISWEAAQARRADAKRQDAPRIHHPFARFAALISRTSKHHR